MRQLSAGFGWCLQVGTLSLSDYNYPCLQVNYKLFAQTMPIQRLGLTYITIKNKKSLYFRRIGLLLLTVGLLCGFTPKESQIPLPQEKPKNYHPPNFKAPYNMPYTIKGKTYYPLHSAKGYKAEGLASWYGSESGNRTAMGTRFIPQNLTAAHRTLPLPSRVKVTNLKNGRSVVVLVNDRGPFRKNRIIDLSQGAAKKIGMKGLTMVKIEHLDTIIGKK